MKFDDHDNEEEHVSSLKIKVDLLGDHKEIAEWVSERLANSYRSGFESGYKAGKNYVNTIVKSALLEFKKGLNK